MMIIYRLKKKYFEPRNIKFRNIVDELQVRMVENELSEGDALRIKEALKMKKSIDHPLYKILEKFAQSDDIPRQDICDAVSLAIYYFNDKKHTKLLRQLYKTW